MNVSLLSENLQKKILFVNHAISNRSQLPILLNFLIEAKDGKLIITATDLEIGITTEIAAKVEEEGATTIPAKIFSELISTIPPGKITLIQKQDGLELRGEKIKTVFQTTPPEDFPKLYQNKGEEVMSIKSDGVEKSFPRVYFSASQDTSRPALSGVLIKQKEDHGEVLLVATDGYRLSIEKNTTKTIKKTQKKEEVSMIVPSRVIKELILMEKGGEGVVAYASSKNNQVVFSQGDTILVGRLIEAEFPAYEKIIPSDFSTKTIFDTEEFRKAVKTCYVFAKETASIVKLSIKKGEVVVSANSPSVGENTVEVEAKTTGEENEIAFNARYLLDLFSTVDAEEMSFEMTGPLNPGVFKIIGDDSFLHLIMPIRVQKEV